MSKTSLLSKLRFVFTLFIILAFAGLMPQLQNEHGSVFDFIRSTFAWSPPNNPPVALNDSFTVHGLTSLPMLANDYDPDGNPISLNAFITMPQHGTLYATPNPGIYTFRPTFGYLGSDQFVYRVCDNLNACSTTTVNLSIVNNAPIAGANSYTTHGVLAVGAPGFLNNDSDPDGNELDPNSYKGCTILPHSYLCKNQDGSLTYSPNYGWVGQEITTFNLCDTLGLCTTETLTFKSINQAPVAVLDFYVAYGGTTLAVPAKGPVANDFDPDGDTVSVAPSWGNGCGPTAHGWLCRSTMGSFNFTPTAGYTGLDNFQYEVWRQPGCLLFRHDVLLHYWRPGSG